MTPAGYRQGVELILDTLEQLTQAQLAAESATPPEGQAPILPAELVIRGSAAVDAKVNEDIVALWCDAKGDGEPLDAAF